MSAFPTGVAIVTAIDSQGQPWGLTCSSLTSVTLRPPTLLICVTTASRTLAIMRRSGHFAVNLLHARARDAAQIFASPASGRFEKVAWQAWGPTGLPHLTDDAFAVADCLVVRSVPIGDHTVVFGQVRQITQQDDRPLLYGLRTYSHWPADAEPPAGRAGESG